MEKNNGLSNSGEVPVDFEVEIEGENGNQTDTETDDNSITVEGNNIVMILDFCFMNS